MISALVYSVLVVDSEADLDEFGNQRLKAYNKQPISKKDADMLAIRLIKSRGLRGVLMIRENN